MRDGLSPPIIDEKLLAKKNNLPPLPSRAVLGMWQLTPAGCAIINLLGYTYPQITSRSTFRPNVDVNVCAIPPPYR